MIQTYAVIGLPQHLLAKNSCTSTEKTMEAKEVAPAQSYAEILTLTYGPTALVIRLQLLATVNSVRAHGDM